MSTLKHLLRYHKILLLGSDKSYNAAPAVRPDDDRAARQLHAKIYRELGYVTPDGVNHLGLMTPAADPYGHKAVYFAVWSSAKTASAPVATGRIIEAAPGDDHMAFQMYNELTLSPEAVATIGSFDPSTCAEVSGLAKRRGESTVAILLLYRAMWQYSIGRHHKLWLMAVDERLFGRIQQLFGPAFQVAGEPVFFRGHTVVPAMLNLETSIDKLIRASKTGSPWQRLVRARLAAFMLHGLPNDLRRTHQSKAKTEA
ncbi:hypothetical protein HJC99_00650 [Candidatus Saccharibacteria bacterium]|nr:hypothetical protein [Candidatus Saccharibacteria bacterium]